MQKTKLGVSVGLLGAIACFSALFGDYIAVLVVAGYILLFEENEWLKKAAVKAVLVKVVIGILMTVIGLIPDLIGLISDFMSIFNKYFTLNIVNSIVNVVVDVLDIFRTVVLLLLGIKALNQGTITVPVVDNLVNKYMGN